MSSSADRSSGLQWVLLSYRVPREPSTPRIAVWRKLKRLGVAQLGDGLVALPADARTREQLEWVAEEVEQAGGSAMLWIARPDTEEEEQRIAAEMAAARAAEYRAVRDQALAARTAVGLDDGAGLLRRLRAELRRIERRDHFPAVDGDAARAAVKDLAAHVGQKRRERA
ncbi:Chromate resistance protein ChrB [Pseudonocardia pini]|uniref:Chromate resistance protein ChrB n=1 Tax=Pseudonocardia pini TaxID=2758030 RepID=UPI0015F0951A|nr:Chromate resistance protein ChrB [Pseudonocardia pini]